MIRTLTSLAVLLSVAGGIFAQLPATRPRFDEFEVASIKPADPTAPCRDA